MVNARRTIGGLFAGAILATVAVACGPDPSSVGYLRSDHCPVGGCRDASISTDAAVPIIPEPLEAWDMTDAGPLSGIFVVEVDIKARVAVPVQLKQLLRLRILQKGTHIREKTTLSAFKLPVVENVATLVIPPALVSVIQGKGVEAEGEFLSSANLLGAGYAPPPFLVLVGAALANPEVDPLPTIDTPQTAIDEDADGHPGVTLFAKVLTCTADELLYAALRTRGKLTGTVRTPDVIDGKVDVGLDESIVGYSNDCLSTATQLKIQIEPGSPFRARRAKPTDDIDGNGNVSCPEIQNVYGEAGVP